MNILHDNDISIPSYGVGSYKTTCPQCSNQRKNKRDKCLSVTIKDSGDVVWLCHHCEWSGGQKKSYKINQTYIKPPKKPNIVMNDKKIPEWIVTFFENRKISLKTLETANIFEANMSFGEQPEPCIAFPYYYAINPDGDHKLNNNDDEIVNVKYRTKDKRFRQEANAQRTLYNRDMAKWWSNEYGLELYFVEGEIDVLTLLECGYNSAVSLPDGASTHAKFDENDKRFKALDDDWLSEVTKVYIGVDDDKAGNALALELAHRFGKHKCVRINWSINGEKFKDANEVLVAYGVDGVKNCINNAEYYPIDGVYKSSEYRKQVFDIYHGRTQKPLSTGFPSLDLIYKVMPSTFHLITGIPNHGKSNFLDQLLINLNRDYKWKFAIFSPEHSSSQHLRRLVEKIVQKPFDIGPSDRMTEQELSDGLKIIENNFYFLESKERLPNIDWILEKAQASIVRYGVRGLVIDPYNMVDPTRASNKREDEHIRDLISACKAFCQRHEVVIWLVAHPNKLRRIDGEQSYNPPSLYDVSGSAHWYNMADVGLVVHRDFEKETTQVITRKIREQGVYGTIGECHFKYNVIKRIYEPEINNPLHWSDN